jgi:hypothetical protein
MKVGELYIDLIVKGGDQSAKATKEVKVQMGGLKEEALAAKAAVLAAVYAFQKLLTGPMDVGSNLHVLSKYTGESVKSIQAVQYALSQAAGVDFDETAQAIGTAFNNIAKYKTSIGPILGGGPLARVLVGTEEDYSSATKFMDYVRKVFQDPRLNQFQKAALGDVLGLSQKMQVALADPKLKNKSLLDFVMPGAMSGKQAETMNRAQGKMDTVARQVKTMLASLSSAIAPDTLDAVSKVLVAVERFATAITSIAAAIGIIKGLKGVLKGLAEEIELFGKSANLFAQGATGEKPLGEAISAGYMKYLEALYMMFIGSRFKMMHPGEKDPLKESLFPKTPATQPKGKQESHSSINQTINIQGNFDGASDVADAVKQETRRAFRQLTSQVQIA